MNKTSFVAALGISVVFWSSCVWGQTPSALVEQGRALYFGTQAFVNRPQVAGASLPAGSGACVSCHGSLGTGVREGIQAAPDITRHAVQDSNGWLVAAMKGKSLTDRTLNTSMPRYQLTPQEQAALTTYAPLLGNGADTVRGVTGGEVLLGVYLSDKANSQAGTQVLAGVTHAFAQANAQGGVHGRKLRVIGVHSPEEAQSVFALVGSLSHDQTLEQFLARHRLPSLAALTLSMEGVKASSWTAPLLPSLQEQAVLLVRTLNSKSTELDCTPWLLDTLQVVDAQDPVLGAVQRFISVEAARLAARPRRLCLGMIATEGTSARLLNALAQDAAQVPLLVSLAAMGAAHTHLPPTLHLQVLPAPSAVAAHADKAHQSVWASLGEAAGHAVVEALARSGSRLQPEVALAMLRGMSGYAPLEGAPLAWSRTRAHGWPPSIWPVPTDLVGLRQFQ
jgi:mono/diheme cytochrome c family protein